jgi:hemerythrin-like domain-containing protein
LTGAAFVVLAPVLTNAAIAQTKTGKTEEKEEGPEVIATEDLMREHGVLRRILIAYSEIAPKLRTNAASVDAFALRRAAQLFQAFGEEYHEKKLEETYIFPAAAKIGGKTAELAQVLLTQHKRGREITQYVLRAAQAKLQPQLADSLEQFVRMYRAHAAREDTVLFPAWRKTMNASQLHEISEKFEDIEHQQFGKDGFEDAVQKIASIEQALGLGDLSRFTAPPLPGNVGQRLADAG